jgi:hypothetical protein
MTAAADTRTSSGNRNEADERRKEQAATERTARAAADTASDAVKAGAAAAEDNVRSVERGVRDAVTELADQSRRAAGSVGEALALQRETVEETAQDLSAAATMATVSAGAVAEVGSAWLDWVGRSFQATTHVSQRLFQSWTPKQAAEAQREFAHQIMQDWMERNARILQVTEEAAGQALRPLRERVQQRH